MESTTQSFYFVQDVMQMLYVKKSIAYQIMRELNKELKEEGYITIDGRVPARYFKEKYYC